MPTRKAHVVDEGMLIPNVEQGVIEVRVIGSSPLICNRMSEKAKRELLLPYGRKTAADRAANLKHDPIAEYRASPYMQREGNTLIVTPGVMFKAAMGTAALDLPGTRKAQVGRLVYVENEQIEVYGIPELSMMITRSADINRTPDVRTRAIIRDWACKFTVAFVEPIVKQSDILRLLSAAGITAGIGDYRPEKGKGAYGRFRIVSDNDDSVTRWNEIVKEGGSAAQENAFRFPQPYDLETEELLGWYMTTAKTRGFTPTAVDLETLISNNGHLSVEQENEEVLA